MCTSSSFTVIALRRALVALVAVVAVACARPEPPRLTPKQATVTAVTLAGVDLRLQMDAYNPNAFDLSARSLTAKMLVDGKYDVGTLTANTGVTLPAGKTTPLDVPASVKWTDLTPLAALSAANRPIPYAVEGTATIGGDKLNVDVPFHFDGTITPEQLKQAVMRSLPILGPGLFPK